MYYSADVEVKTTLSARLVVDIENEDDVERYFMEDADFDYNDFDEIGTPTIKVKNIRKFEISKENYQKISDYTQKDLITDS